MWRQVMAKHQGQVNFNFHMAPDIPKMVQADSTRLLQICYNVLSNSNKFTERGSISFSILVVEHFFCFSWRGSKEQQMFRCFLSSCFLSDIFSLSAPAAQFLMSPHFKGTREEQRPSKLPSPFIWVVGVNAVILIIQVVPSERTSKQTMPRSGPYIPCRVGSSLTGSNKMHDASSSSVDDPETRAWTLLFERGFFFFLWSNWVGALAHFFFKSGHLCSLNLLLFLGSESLMSGFYSSPRRCSDYLLWK